MRRIPILRAIYPTTKHPKSIIWPFNPTTSRANKAIKATSIPAII